jgi:hypothetical protein
MKYLITETETYVVDTLAEVEELHQELQNNPSFTLGSFGWKEKEIKAKGEVIDSYFLCNAKKIFNSEKEPISTVEIIYEVH